jgi:O-acetylhomoserine (thiol)-lyase
MNTKHPPRFDTLRIHAGYSPEEHNNAIQVPIYQTAAFDILTPERAERLVKFEETGFLYTRVGNPTLTVLEARVAALDGAVAAVAVASGMSAVSFALLNVAEGGRLLAAARIYGGTFDAYKKIYPNLGVAVDLIEDIHDLPAIERLIREDTKAIFIETISNPLGTVADIEALACLAHRHGLPLIADNTLATPYLLNPLQYGADIVVYSATKALSGHGAVIGGLILEAGTFDWLAGRHPQFAKKEYTFGNRNTVETFPAFPFTGRIRTHYLALLGAALSPFDAFLILQGIETLSERIDRQSRSALKIAEFLRSCPDVKWVRYPALEGDPSKKLADRYLPKGSGGVLSFGFDGSKAERYTFIRSLKLFSYHANLGDARSLIINSPCTTHHELDDHEQACAGITPDTIRLSIGLEDVNDLINDLRQAF